IFDTQKNTFRNKRDVLRNFTSGWTDHNIFFKAIDPIKLTNETKEVFKLLSKKLCFRFAEFPNNNNPPKKKGFCLKYSNDEYGTHLGKQLDTEECQFIYLRDTNVNTTELLRWVLYGLGFDFEHNRADRRNYHVIHRDNIEPKFLPYVKKKKNNLESFYFNHYLQSACCKTPIYCRNGGTPSCDMCNKCFCDEGYHGSYCEAIVEEDKTICPLTSVELKKPDGFNMKLINVCQYSIT
ncbi:Astacin-like metalloendopeptidase, partial [Strongyloides ratti]